MKPTNPLHPHHKYPPIGKMVDKKQLVTNMIIAVVTVGLSLLVVIYTSNIAGPIPISVSQTSSEQLEPFSVQGTSEMVTSPDELQVTVGLEATAPTVQQAKDAVNQTNEAIIAAMHELGVEKDNIKTINYSVRPVRDYTKPRTFGMQNSAPNPMMDTEISELPTLPQDDSITGYTVSTSLEVKTQELDTLNQIIDAATANGANNVSGVSFGLSAEKEQELVKEARKQAIDDAKRNAKELAGLADMRLGKVINVIEHSSPGPIPMAYAMRAESMDVGMGAPTDIQAGTTSYEYSVTLVYETR